MKCISKDMIYEYEIKKSKFITYIYKVNNIEEIKKYLDQIKSKYSDATHICYAYKIDDKIKFSDDNEPGGTAGLPMMEVINKNDLNSVLAVVVRYFGGIKLGSGGLIRAYQKGLKELINEKELINLIDGKRITVTIKYEDKKQFEYFTKNMKVINVNYDNDIKYTIDIPNNDLDLFNNYNYEIIVNIKIESNSTF